MTDESFPSLQDQFLRCVGRNLWCYQQVEAQLKALLSVSGGGVKIQAGKAVLRRDIDGRPRRMLGELAEALTSHILRPKPATPDLKEGNLMEWWFSVRGESDFSEDLRQQVSTVVGERNDLVHHAVQRWNLEDEASLKHALTVLDEQYGRVVAVHSTLRRIGEAVLSGIQDLIAVLGSSEFRERLRSERLNAALCDAVVRAARADGWTPLSRVGQLFNAYLKSVPEPERPKLPKLSRLLSESGVFELREEPLVGGGARTLCRLKHSGS